jgi:uncharacterized protein
MKLPWIVLFFLISGGLMAQNFPTPADPPKLVNDFASLLTPQEQQALERKLVAFDDSTSTQIAIVIVNTLNGYDVADYSFELAESWGIGQAGEYNGILILIAPNERRMFIATGYGVEGFIPDAIAKRIVEGTLKPNFRNEEYFVGLDQATNLLMGLLSGQFSAQQLEEKAPVLPFLLILLIFIGAMFFLVRFGNRSRGYRGRGGHTYMGPIRGGTTWTDFSRGSGTFGGGGGFGGFGGGSFGGGGAGGSW